MRIVEEEQLDFDDLMMSPKRSTLNSRSEVSLFREFKWRNAIGKDSSLRCIPIVIANMGTIGVPSMAKVAARRGFMCALEKHLLSSDILKLYEELEDMAVYDKKPIYEYTQRIMPTFGLKEDMALLDVLMHDHDVRCVCIDVPNGYVPKFVLKVAEIREKCPDALIFAGSVVTGDICQDIILTGGNVAKVGIGPGCFTGKMNVLTKSGYKHIQDINEGDFVLTHNGTFECVVNKFTYNSNK